MQLEGLDPDCVTVASILSACASTGALVMGKQLHSYALKAGITADIINLSICNALVSLYARCGKTREAYLVFDNMNIKDNISWNGLISGFAQSGHLEEALKVFSQMNKAEVEPNHVTFVGVLTACSHVGLVNEGLCYFESMSKEYGLVPKPEHYACVVDLLSRAGLLSRAKKFVEEMPIKPDAMVWRTLLSACVVHKDVELGEVAAQHLLDLEPEDSATYVLLSNMYAVSRKWNYRDRTRQMMKNRRVKKEPGRSWIEVKNKSHAFFVGDRLHPLADKIYEYLDKLNNRAAEIGYVQDHNSLLNETELEQKDPTQYVHSEKLAITFALLSLPDGFPIRVMKNLRVCNDCHNWIKFVSRISNREIVVRDAYRFHHFEEGTCSCKDFW
ncbi:Pentatricopeptide repeat-containing protein At4g13650 [Linum perenne]